MNSDSLSGYNVDNLEASFREFLLTQHASPVTLKNYLSDFRHFFGWLFFTARSNNTLSQLDTHISIAQAIKLIQIDLITRYKEYLVLNKIPFATINRRLSTLRKFCSYCIQQGWMRENPAKKVNNQTHAHTSNPTSIQSIKPIKADFNQADILKKFRLSLNIKDSNQSNTNTIFEDVNEFFTIINS